MWNPFRKLAVRKALPGHLSSVISWPNNSGDQYPGQWQTQETRSTRGVVNDMMLIPSVYAAVNKIASSIARMPMKLNSLEADGEKVEQINHPISRLLKKPNHFQTRYEWLHRLSTNLLLWGNCYTFIERDQRGVPSALYHLNPVYVTPMTSDDGSIFYQINRKGSGSDENLQMEILPAREIIHFRISAMGDSPLCGYAPLLAAAVSARTSMAIQNNSQGFFSNMSRTSGILTTENKLSPELAARVKTQWEDMTTSRNFGKTCVLSDGLQWQALTLTAADSQLIEQLNFSIADVARVFSIPAHMIGATTENTQYKSAEANARDFYTHSLASHIENIECRMTESLGLKSNLFVEFDLTAYLRSEFSERMTAYKEGLQSGTYTINETRKLEGLPPVDGGDVPYIQSQNIPLEVAAQAEHEPVDVAPTAAETSEADVKQFQNFLTKSLSDA